jgi:hypothetical protein
MVVAVTLETVAPAGMPVPCMAEPITILAVLPDVTVSVGLPEVLVTTKFCLPLISAPKAEITLLDVPPEMGRLELDTVPTPSMIQPLPLMPNWV